MSPHSLVYTATFNNFDYEIEPVAVDEGVAFVRYADRRSLWPSRWSRRAPPEESTRVSPRLSARYIKVCSHKLPLDCETLLWVDSSIKIKGSIAELVEEFEQSGCDIALFRHPSGRSVREEIAFCKEARRIPVSQYERAAAQEARYAQSGVIDRGVYETPIVFRRRHAAAIPALESCWWSELETFTERDQVSLNHALEISGCRVHEWSWHFDQPNKYFMRVRHRPKNFMQRIKVGAYYLNDCSPTYYVAHKVIRGLGWIRQQVAS